MDLLELAFSCYVYGHTTGFDESFSEFKDSVGHRLDLLNNAHQKALLKWLNSWGCRNFAVAYHDDAAAAIEDWFREHGKALPKERTSLVDLDWENLDPLRKAYDDLANRVASKRTRSGASFDVRVGPTAASKILFALRPDCLVPWDDPFRSSSNYLGDGSSYVEFLKETRSRVIDIRSACEKAGVDFSKIPALLGRPDSSVPKLVDEYNWMTVTLGCPAPDLSTVQEWLEWVKGNGIPSQVD